MKIQLKRSNVITSGEAKQPESSQMEFGELAVNYATADPALFLKDDNDNIIRIAGAGAVGNDDKLPLAGGTMTGTIDFSVSQPTATTSSANIVLLNSATDSDSETEAATPKAVKAAMDKAEEALNVDGSPWTQDASDLYPKNLTSNVGIGLSDPEVRFHVRKGGSSGTSSYATNTMMCLERNASAALQFSVPNDKVSQILFGDADSAVSGVVLYNHLTDNMQFNTAGSARVNIDNGGKVGIGTSDPQAKLDVRATAQYDGIRLKTLDGYNVAELLAFNENGNSGGLALWDEDNSKAIQLLAGGNSYINGGNVGIGTDNPSNTLTVESSTNIPGFFNSTSNFCSVAIADTAGSVSVGTTLGAFRINTGGTANTAGGGTERLRISSDGLMTVGAQSNDSQLGVISDNALGIRSQCATAQTDNVAKALKVSNGSTTNTFSVSYKGRLTASVYNIEALPSLPA